MLPAFGSCILVEPLQDERLVRLIKVKTPQDFTHVYSITLTDLILQTGRVKAAASVLQAFIMIRPFIECS